MTTKVIVTKHGQERMRRRLGIPKKTVQRAALRAFNKGIKRKETKGQFRLYLDDLYFKSANTQKANNIRVFGEHVYIFCDHVLITVYSVPTTFTSAIKVFKSWG